MKITKVLLVVMVAFFVLNAHAAQATMTDLKVPDQLKSLFQRDGGKVRLIILLSPT